MQNPEPPTHRGIPKHIHQMWKTHEVPAKWRDQQEHCRKLNPDFEYTLWSDDDILAFLKREYPWFVSTYLSYPYPISRPDAARYFILYHFGGVYLDIDIDCKTPFKQIVNVTKDMDTVLAATAPFGITNNFMASEAGDTFLKYVVQGLVAAKGWYVVPHMTVMLSAGPLYVFSRYNSYPCKDRIKLITVEDHKRFFHHEQAATWHNWDGRVVIWLDHHHTVAITVIIVAITIVILGIIRWTYRRFKQNRPPFKKFCACSRGDTVWPWIPAKVNAIHRLIMKLPKCRNTSKDGVMCVLSWHRSLSKTFLRTIRCVSGRKT